MIYKTKNIKITAKGYFLWGKNPGQKKLVRTNIFIGGKNESRNLKRD